MEIDEAYSSDDGDRQISDEVIIENAPIAEDGLEGFLLKSRHIAACLHPIQRSGACWIAGKIDTKRQRTGETTTEQEKRIYCFNSVAKSPLQEQHNKLISQSAQLFEELQTVYDDVDADILPAVARSSRQHRSLLIDFADAGAKLATTEGLTEDDEYLVQGIMDSNTVWHCAEAIYLPLFEGDARCDALMDWVNRFDPRPTVEEGEDILALPKPCEHPDFWDYVSKGVLRGLFDMTATVLTNSGLMTTSSVSRIINELSLLLKTCPRAATYIGKSDEYRLRYKAWRAKMLNASKNIEATTPELSSAIRQVYELLKGDRDAIFRQCDTWQEGLAAMALLYDPVGCRAPKDVRALYDIVVDSEDSVVSVDLTLPADVACAALCTGNIPKAIASAKQVDLAMAAQVADLLEKTQVLEEIKSGDLQLTLRDVLVLDLGDQCAETGDTWRAAITYWRTVGDAGLDRIAQILPRIPLINQARTDELLEICNELEMDDEAAEIDTAWGRRLELTGAHIEAANAFDRAGNPRHIDRMNWNLFKQSLLAGKAVSTSEEMEAALQAPEYTASRTISCLLAPYATLSYFYSTSDQADKAKHLAALIKMPDMPKDFVPLLMAEMLPLLLDNHFSQRDLFDSLASIEEYYESVHFCAGLTLLSDALEADTKWKHGLPATFNAADVLALVRVRIAHAIGRSFVSTI